MLGFEALLAVNQKRLYLAPIDNPQNVLDIGTGVGDWAIKFGKLPYT